MITATVRIKFWLELKPILGASSKEVIELRSDMKHIAQRSELVLNFGCRDGCAYRGPVHRKSNRA
jgi:hypothetical protein